MSNLVDQTGATPTASIQLNWEQKDGKIVVTPNDEDRFVIKIGQAIEILRQHEKRQKFQKQFRVLLKRLAGWLGENNCWDRAYLTASESSLRFVVVRKQVAFDEKVTDDLSDLGASIANDPDLDLIKLSARALPLASEESLASFLDPSFLIEFNGERTGAH